MQRLEKSFSSLAVCYAFLASLAALLLIDTRLELQANPPDWSSIIGGFVHGSNPIHSVNWAQLWIGARSALFALRGRLHTTWLFFGVFAAVWLASLLWMEIERHRRGIDFTRRQAWWTIAFSLAVFAMAVLYGLGTNGILAMRFPGIVPVSDIVAAGFLLALPLAAWSRLDRLQEEQEDTEPAQEDPAPKRSRGFLGLNDDATSARLMESLSRIEMIPVDMLPAVQAFHPEVPSEPAKAAATPFIESAEAPAVAVALEPAPTSIVPAIAPAIAPVSVVASVSGSAVKRASAGVEGFRHHLSAMIQSWDRIAAIRREIDDWFEQRRREAIAHLDMHPGMRNVPIEKTLFHDFPSEKLAAVDAEWAEIRKAATEIHRWFGELD